MPILKPESCKGCPFYSKSKYITPDYIIPDSIITILAQAPGQHEEEGSKLEGSYYERGKRVEITTATNPQPLIGAAGNWLRREFWPLTKLDYDQVSLCNVIKCRPYDSNELPGVGGNKVVNGITVKELKEAVAFCTRTHLHIPASTRFVLAMGELSLYSLTGEELLNYKSTLETPEDTESPDIQKQKKSTITEWRGWCLGKSISTQAPTLGLVDYYAPEWTDLKIFPVLHPAALLRNDTFYHATLLDFERFGKLVRGEWPKALPEYRINHIPASLPRVIGFDTEYKEAEAGVLPVLKMWSMADVESNIYVIDAQYSTALTGVPKNLVLVTQNGIVDLPHLLPLVGNTRIFMQDCMLAHAVLWPGEYHSLDYQLSKYGDYNRHKHLRETSNQELRYLYSGLDAHTTLNNCWKQHVYHFKRDRLLWLEYMLRRQPLLDIISRFQEKGIRVDQERVQVVSQLLEQEMNEIQREVYELTKNPDFNVRSNKQVGEFLYGV